MFSNLLLVSELDIGYPMMFWPLTIISLLGMALIVFFFIHNLIHTKHVISKAICLFGCFICGFIFWLGVFGGYGDLSLKSFGQTISNSIKMFALSVNVSDFPVRFQNSDTVYSTYVLILMYLESVICFAVISLTILTSIGRSAVALFGNSIRFWKKWFCNDKHHCKDVIFTDLPYSSLSDFLSVRSRANDNIIIVLKQDEQLTQQGTELKNAYLSHGYFVKVGPLFPNYIEKFFKLKHWRTIRIYSCFLDDSDNLAFADSALSVIRKKCWKMFGEDKKYNDSIFVYIITYIPKAIVLFYKSIIVKRKNKKDIPEVKKVKKKQAFHSKTTFYISYQDPDFEHRYNYAADSHGLINFFSEYDWVSSVFVFRNPAFRIIDLKKAEQIKQTIPKRAQFHVDYIGFGGINQAVLKKMIPAYYLPDTAGSCNLGDDVYPEVVFRVFDKEFISEKEISSRYRCCRLDESDKYLSQYALPSIKTYQKDFLSQAVIDEYCTSIAKNILNIGEQIMIVISMGSTYENIEIAAKIRSRFLQDQKDGNLAKKLENDEDKEKKLVLIYPYIKEASLFRADYHMFGYKTSSLKRKDIKYKFCNVLDSRYESSRLYVFDLDYEVSSLLNDGVNKKSLKELTDRLFRDENIPIIPFGRGGFLPGDEERHIMDMAKAANLIYGQDFDGSPYRTIDGRYIYSKDFIDEKWGNSLDLPYEAKSNFYLAISIPNKLRYLGYRLRPFDYHDAKKDEKIKENDACLLSLRKILPSYIDCSKNIDGKRFKSALNKHTEIIAEIPLANEKFNLIEKRNYYLLKIAEKMAPIIKSFVTKKVNGVINKVYPIKGDESGCFETAKSIYNKLYWHCKLKSDEIVANFESSLLKIILDSKSLSTSNRTNRIQEYIISEFKLTDIQSAAFSYIRLFSYVLSEIRLEPDDEEKNKEKIKKETERAFKFIKNYFDLKQISRNKKLESNHNDFNEVVKKSFTSEWDGWQENNHDEIAAELLPVLQPYLLALYDIGEESLISDEGLQLAKMEHARWYFFNAGNGVMPMPKAKIFEEKNIRELKFNTKNDLKDVHICMTDCEGLEEIKQQMILKLPLGKSFLISDFVIKPDGEKESFEKSYPNLHKALEGVFSLCYWADTFSIAEILTILRYRKGKPLTKDDELKNLMEKYPNREVRKQNQFYFLERKKDK